ncbi:MAG TPA: hypothetical protein VFW40_01060, partial [Capsulimonadaceae bacterium]|nr:hypothetical protein [Capsulimonadaceae bacterium]
MGSKKSAILALSVAAIGIVAAGCAQHNSSQPAPPVQTLQTAAPAQPYTVVASLPVKPAVVEQRRRALHLTRRNNQFYLADNTGDYYDVGRDPNGNLYPVYYDREIGQYSPLYYDGARDRYYCAVQENGRFYRRYWNDPRDLYYDNQFDYADYNPPVEDRPVV